MTLGDCGAASSGVPSVQRLAMRTHPSVHDEVAALLGAGALERVGRAQLRLAALNVLGKGVVEVAGADACGRHGRQYARHRCTAWTAGRAAGRTGVAASPRLQPGRYTQPHPTRRSRPGRGSAATAGRPRGPSLKLEGSRERGRGMRACQRDARPTQLIRCDSKDGSGLKSQPPFPADRPFHALAQMQHSYSPVSSRPTRGHHAPWERPAATRVTRSEGASQVPVRTHHQLPPAQQAP